MFFGLCVFSYLSFILCCWHGSVSLLFGALLCICSCTCVTPMFEKETIWGCSQMRGQVMKNIHQGQSRWHCSQKDSKDTIPWTCIAPRNRTPKRKVVSQPSIFRGYVSFREGRSLKPLMINQYKGVGHSTCHSRIDVKIENGSSQHLFWWQGTCFSWLSELLF